MDIHEWLRVDGSTPRERIRNGYRQFIVVGVLVWAGVFVVWEFLSLVVGPAAAAVVVVVLAVYVALDLRDRMIGPLEDEGSSEPPEEEPEGTAKADGAKTTEEDPAPSDNDDSDASEAAGTDQANSDHVEEQQKERP